MRGASVSPLGGLRAQSVQSGGPEPEETSHPLLPRRVKKEEQQVNKDQWQRYSLSRELSLIGFLAVGFGLLGCAYLAQRSVGLKKPTILASDLQVTQPHKLQTADLYRLTIDVGLGEPQITNISARELTDKAHSDKRKYEIAKLPNGLEVLAVQDEKSLKSAFAMAVRAGSFNDPEDLPGLAHFCEHMLFLGTKKFPEPSGFDDFMAKSGGQDNAYTAMEVTVYYGEVSHPAGDKALERFADFFREPLFNKRFVRKEVHAIDSEHAKNVQSPTDRVIQTLNSLADPKSPVGRFHTGNFDTLYMLPKKRGKSPVDALGVYFKNHYCPEQMRLVSFGPDSPAEQLGKAAKLFGPIPEGNHKCRDEHRTFAKPNAWPAERLGKWLSIEGTEPQPQLWLTFPLPDLSKDYLSQPLQYMDYVLNYAGEDSLKRVLQDVLGLASQVETMFDGSSSGTSAYFLATLTPKGQQHPESVLDVFYAYISSLQSIGVNEELYKTIANVMRLKWDWAEPAGPSSTASDLAERMTRLPESHLLSGDTRIDDPDPKLVASLLKKIAPENMNVAFVVPKYTEHAKDKIINTLPYYNVKYSVEDLESVLPGAQKRWKSWLEHDADTLEENLASRLSHADLIKAGSTSHFPKVPKPIDDVPKEISLAHMSTSKKKKATAIDEVLFGPRPSRLSFKPEKKSGADPTLPEVWYRSGWITESPKVTIQLDLRPLVSRDDEEASAFDSVRLGLYSSLLGAEIAPKMADLTATGVSYDISVSAHGLSFSFSGFAPMLPLLVETVLAEFNRFNQNSSITPPSRFQRIRDELKEELGTYAAMPVQYAVMERILLLSKGRHSNEESLAELDKVNVTSAATSANELLLARPLQLTALAMGNLDEETATKAVSMVWDGLHRHLSSASIHHAAHGEVERVSRVVNPSQPVEVRARNPRPGDPNDVVVVSILSGPGTVERRVLLGLLGHILQNTAYNELRTSRQLGYVVSAGSGMLSNVQYMSTLVQGTVLDADDVEIAIEVVLTELMPRRLEKLSQTEFASYVHSFQEELLQPPIAPSEEVGQFWGPVRQGAHCFDLRAEILEYLKAGKLSRQLLQKTWQEFIMPSDGTRKRVVVKYFAKEVPDRLESSKALSTWRKQGLSKAAAKRLMLEREHGVVLDRADSAARAKLLKSGEYYPPELNCRYLPDKAS